MIAVVTFVIFRLAREAQRIATPRPFVFLPLAGLLVAGLGIAFSQTTDHGVNEVLFSGQDALGPLVANPGAWSLSALALLIAFKGLAYGVSLGTFRGGPTFPAMFLGAAAGLMAAQLPGFELTPAVAVGIGARGRCGAATAAGSGRPGHGLHGQRRRGFGAPGHRRGGGGLPDRAGSPRP